MPSNVLYYGCPGQKPLPNEYYVYQNKEGEWFVSYCTDEDSNLREDTEITNPNLILLLECKEKALLKELIINSLIQIKQSFRQHSELPFKFDYAEHYDIGQSVKDLLIQHFPNHRYFKEGKVELGHDFQIELSELYALMGDFFGLPEQSISLGKTMTEQMDIFKRSFETLYNKDPQQIKDILVIGAIQKQAIQLAKQNCQCIPRSSCDCAEKALESVSSITNQLWNKVTGGAYYLYPIFQGDYLKLSKNNIDHFAESAKSAYTAGHELALKLIDDIAEEYKKEIQDLKKIEQLTHQVLAIEASAGHFLTDSFSSGHVRVPRKELYELKTLFGIPVPAAITGLFTLVMHNEDGKNGVWVTDKLTGNVWKSYGDDSLLTGKGKDNRIKVCAAARMGMLEIIGQLKKAQGLDVQGEQYPKWGTIYQLFPEQCTDINSNQPLFKKDDQGQLLRRKDVNDPSCKEYMSNWWVGTTLLLLLPRILEYIGFTMFSASSSETKQEETNNQRIINPRQVGLSHMNEHHPDLQLYKEQVEQIKNLIDREFSDNDQNSSLKMMGLFNQHHNGCSITVELVENHLNANLDAPQFQLNTNRLVPAVEIEEPSDCIMSPR